MRSSHRFGRRGSIVLVVILVLAVAGLLFLLAPQIAFQLGWYHYDIIVVTPHYAVLLSPFCPLSRHHSRHYPLVPPLPLCSKAST